MCGGGEEVGWQQKDLEGFEKESYFCWLNTEISANKVVVQRLWSDTSVGNSQTFQLRNGNVSDSDVSFFLPRSTSEVVHLLIPQQNPCHQTPTRTESQFQDGKPESQALPFLPPKPPGPQELVRTEGLAAAGNVNTAHKYSSGALNGTWDSPLGKLPHPNYIKAWNNMIIQRGLRRRWGAAEAAGGSDTLLRPDFIKWATRHNKDSFFCKELSEEHWKDRYLVYTE